MSHLVAVQLAALHELLGELTALAAELRDDGAEAAATARSLTGALDGGAGASAGAAGAGWAATLTALAARTLAVATTLDAALDAYRAADEQLAQRLVAGPIGRTAVAS